MIFNAGMERADRPAGEDRDARQRDQRAPGTRPGHDEGEARQHDRRDVVIALPPAQSARVEVAEILERQRARHQRERHAERERAGGGQAALPHLAAATCGVADSLRRVASA